MTAEETKLLYEIEMKTIQRRPGLYVESERLHVERWGMSLSSIRDILSYLSPLTDRAKKERGLNIIVKLSIEEDPKGED